MYFYGYWPREGVTLKVTRYYYGYSYGAILMCIPMASGLRCLFSSTVPAIPMGIPWYSYVAIPIGIPMASCLWRVSYLLDHPSVSKPWQELGQRGGGREPQRFLLLGFPSLLQPQGGARGE